MIKTIMRAFNDRDGDWRQIPISPKNYELETFLPSFPPKELEISIFIENDPSFIYTHENREMRNPKHYNIEEWEWSTDKQTLTLDLIRI